MDDALAAATTRSTARVLGIDLRPLSLWHVHALDALANPLGTGDFAPLGSPTVFHWLADLIANDRGPDVYVALREAVAVCSAGYDPTLLAVRIGCRLSLRERLRARRYGKRILAELETFWHWRREGLTLPQTTTPKAGPKSGFVSKPLACPRPFALMCAMRARFHMTSAEAWEMPYAEAAWMEIALREREDPHLRVVDERLRRLLAAADERKEVPA